MLFFRALYCIEMHSDNTSYGFVITAMYKQHMLVSYGTQRKRRMVTVNHSVYRLILIKELWLQQVLEGVELECRSECLIIMYWNSCIEANVIRAGSVQKAAQCINNVNLRSVALSFCSTVGSFPLDAKLVRPAQSCAQTNYLINVYSLITTRIILICFIKGTAQLEKENID